MTGSSDPRLAALRRRLAAHRPYQAPRRDPLFEAGVTLVLRARDEIELLLIERVERVGDPWSGHMALPGGRREPADADLLATALRETEEEVAIALDPGRHLLGALDEVHPVSRHLPEMVIAPWVAVVGPEVEAVPQPSEVATAIWMPLSHLGDDAALSEVLIELEGDSLSFPSFRYQDYQIWGLTFRILEGFLDLYRGEAAKSPG